MALDALKGYLQLASGLGDLTRAKAIEAADALLTLSSSLVSTPVASQVASLADEIMAAASTNRESLKALVRAEVESAVARALAAQSGELDRARVAMARIGRGVSRDAAVPSRDTHLQHEVATEAQQGSPVSSPITRNEGSMATKKAAPAKKAVVKKTTAAKKAVTKKAAPVKRAPAKRAVVTKAASAKKATPTKTTTVKKTASPEKVAPVKKAVVKKAAPATKAATKKTTTKTAPKRTTAKKAPASSSPAKKTSARKSATKTAAKK